MAGWLAFLQDLAGLRWGPGTLRSHHRRQRGTLLSLQDGRGPGASLGGQRIVLGGFEAVFYCPFWSKIGAAAVDAMSHSLVHPQHLRISGGVRAEGALVAWEALPVQGYLPAALAPHTQIHRGQTGVKGGGLSRAVGSEKRPL